jgi:DNA integrity scanning protein DisA with diadenylate cyclase activity
VTDRPSHYRRLMAENDAKHRQTIAIVQAALIDGATLIKHTLDVIDARRRLASTTTDNRNEMRDQ